ncbi:MAG: mammalian cell entry protein [Nocardia sp.]|uniref:MlaD family protein n=1 Tax=Nocardia sp. TaxID=1821 RepID=UPI00345638EE|nr:mammalian cell entry protein [Nocardia sp.]
MYGMPGVAMDQRRSLLLGGLALAVVTVLALTLLGVQRLRGEDSLRVVLRTEQTGAGIKAGTQVRLNGVQVGEITAVTPGEGGGQRIALALNKSQLFGLTDILAVDYAPSSLFGISELELKRGSGGTPLTQGAVIDLTGARAEQVRDATMGTLIRALTRTTNGVLTPELARALGAVADSLDAFTPLLQVVVDGSRAVADTQRYPASFLIDQFSSALEGAAPMIGGTIQLFDYIHHIDMLRTQRDLYDATIRLLADDAFAPITALGRAAEPALSGYTEMLPPLLNTVSQMVPTPQLSGEQLRAMLDRLGADFADGPNGPVLNVAVTLRGVPALAQPLLGRLPGGGGPR